MSNRVLVIKMNLLPWYNELDDQLELFLSSFPVPVRERIQTLGEFQIISINRYQTRLRQIQQIPAKD